MNVRLKSIIPHFMMMLFGVLIVIITPFQVEVSNSSGEGPRYLYYFTGGLIILLSLNTCILNFIKIKKEKAENEFTEKQQKKSYSRVILSLILILLWILTVGIVGFITTTVLFIAGLMLILGERRLLVIVITSIVFSLLTFYVFNNLLRISLPAGFLL